MTATTEKRSTHLARRGSNGPVPGHGRRRMVAAIAVVLSTAAVLGGVVVWQRNADDHDRAVAQAIAERDAARGDLIALAAESEELRSTVETLEGNLAANRRELRAMLGPVLDDGTHFGHLVAVGTQQDPPRLVIDIEQWFTDEAAVQAAIDDGVTVEPGINGYYIRNESPRWRMVEIDPSATVTLTTPPFADPSAPVTVTLERFGELLASYRGRSLLMSPYWIDTEDGRVVGIEEQFIP